jgi:drug/metabolite transporter (DMT)-like permease
MQVMKPSTEPVSIFTPVFLIVIALLIYVASTLFLFIIASRLTEKEMDHYWFINSYSNILVSSIFSAAFILVRYQKKQPPPESHSVDFTFPNDR